MKVYSTSQVVSTIQSCAGDEQALAGLRTSKRGFWAWLCVQWLWKTKPPNPIP